MMRFVPEASPMSTVERLSCPYCRTLLNPGAFVCHGCGAARGVRQNSPLVMFLVFPAISIGLAWLMTLGKVALGLAILAALVAYAVMIGIYRNRPRGVEWARGAEAGNMVVEEARPMGRVESVEDKVCPQCAETVKRAAKICRFCRHEFEPAGMVIDGEAVMVGPAPEPRAPIYAPAEPQPTARSSADATAAAPSSHWRPLLAVAAILIALGGLIWSSMESSKPATAVAAPRDLDEMNLRRR